MANMNKSKVKGADKVKKRKHLPKTIGGLTLWNNILNAYVCKDASNYAIKRSKNMYVDFTGLYSGSDKVTYVYTIDGYPRELELSYATSIRRLCRGDTRVSFITQMDRDSIPWETPKMKARLRTWRTIEKEGPEVDAYNLIDNISTLNTQEWRKESVVYLASADRERGRKLFKSRTCMFISGTRGQDFDTSVEAIVKYCRVAELKATRVIGAIPKYLKVFSPFANNMDNDVLKDVGAISVPDEILARFNTTEQGVVGREGTYFGTDVLSGFPALKKVKQNTEQAENILITAETGGGKSFFVKAVLVQLLAQPHFRGTIMDIEGFEYIPLANYMTQMEQELWLRDQRRMGRTDSDEELLAEFKSNSVVVINMAEGQGVYFDPVEIILTGDEKLDKDMYGLSTSFTLSLFKCLLGNIIEDVWVDIVINEAIAKTYENAGVSVADMTTWINSKGLRLSDVYDTLKDLKRNGDASNALNTALNQSEWAEEYTDNTIRMFADDVHRLTASNEGFQQAIDMCLAKLSVYFDELGLKRHLFTHRVTVDSIMNAKLVICSFGMAGKSDSAVDPIQMSLMQLYAANISHLRSVFSKQQGKFNFKLWEEFQRWGGFPDADKTINVALTGGRKLGDVNIIVTNKVSEMLGEDRFKVFDNITTYIIGAITDSETRHKLCTRLSIPQMQSALDTIAINNQDKDAYLTGDFIKTNTYRKAFLVGLDKTMFTITKMMLPDGIANSALFRTGIDLQN